MIYLDTSVALASLLVEDRRPPDAFWDDVLVSSRLLEYEIWTRIHGRVLGASHAEAVQGLLARVGMIALIPEVLGRAREPWPMRIRTLDALHLASAHFLAEQGQQVAVASYDARMLDAARGIGLGIHPL
ncbi:MAG: PIN domain-containing protein [Gemmatimonadota bacterium]